MDEPREPVEREGLTGGPGPADETGEIASDGLAGRPGPADETAPVARPDPVAGQPGPADETDQSSELER